MYKESDVSVAFFLSFSCFPVAFLNVLFIQGLLFMKVFYISLAHIWFKFQVIIFLISQTIHDIVHGTFVKVLLFEI